MNGMGTGRAREIIIDATAKIIVKGITKIGGTALFSLVVFWIHVVENDMLAQLELRQFEP